MNTNFFTENIFSHRCVACDHLVHGNSIFCNYCYEKLEILPTPYCSLCGTPINHFGICTKCKLDTPSFSGGFSLFPYEGVVASTVKRGKYGNNRWIFKRLAHLLIPLIEYLDPDYILPVPSTPANWFSRGFNPTLTMARSAIYLLSNKRIKLLYKSLFKKRGIPSQTSLKISKRKALSSKDFYMERKIPKGDILIIDDVYTTGSTIKAVSDQLRKYTDDKIYFLTIARTLI